MTFAGTALVLPSRAPEAAMVARSRAQSGQIPAHVFAENIDPELQAVAGTLAMAKFEDAAIRRALPIYRHAVEDLLARLRGAPTLEAAKARLYPVALPGLDELLHRLLVTAELTGRATLFEQAQAQTKQGIEDLRAMFADSQGDVPEGFDFDPLPPQEALDFFRRKVPVTDMGFRKLNATMKHLGFSIAGVESDALLDAVRGKLDEALQGNVTLGEFLRDAPALFEAYGVVASDRRHLETVFRTNTLTALNAGKWQEAQDPALEELFPLYRYSAILDDRTRPAHEAMHGHTAPRDDPFWSTWWPPNGFNCRCTVVPLSTVYIERHGVTRSRQPNPKLKPDTGFDTNPLAALQRWEDAA